MKRLAALAFVIGLSGVAFGDAHVMGNNKTLTIDCAKDKSAMVMGNQNTITMTGTCSSLSVQGNKNIIKSETATAVDVLGNDNTVTVTAADTISITGNTNHVSWKKGATGKAPSVTDTGKDNKVTQTK